MGLLALTQPLTNHSPELSNEEQVEAERDEEVWPPPASMRVGSCQSRTAETDISAPWSCFMLQRGVLMNRFGMTVGVALLVTLSVSCGGSGSSNPTPTPTTPTPPTIALGGTYSGSVSDSTGPGRMTWTISQAGTSLSGPVTATTELGTVSFTGTLSGTLSGTSLSFTINVPAGSISGLPSCSATITGTATGVTTSTIAGTYTGTNSCTGPFSAGQFSLTKQ